tara:strand:- start:762 stop:1379 length:618 start_codon:yes stop_codon:yes gene_type:complete
MSFGINGFRSNLIGGGARPSLFEVALSFPTLSASSSTTTTTTTNGETTVTPSSKFLIKGASIPTSTIGTYDVHFHGKQVRIAGDRTFETWDTNIINDEGFEIRYKLEKWMELIQNHKLNTRSETLGTKTYEGENADYKKDLTVTQYSKQGTTLRQYKFIGAFPTTLSAIALDWGTSEIEEFTCSWTYDRWEAEDKTTAARTIIGA